MFYSVHTKDILINDRVSVYLDAEINVSEYNVILTQLWYIILYSGMNMQHLFLEWR